MIRLRYIYCTVIDVLLSESIQIGSVGVLDQLLYTFTTLHPSLDQLSKHVKDVLTRDYVAMTLLSYWGLDPT
jgi:hypothetical protein